MRPLIAIDGVFFQIDKTGIARVWSSLLKIWAEQDFGGHLILLDRDSTAPKFDGIRTRVIPRYDYGKTAGDREFLQQVCDEEGVDLFISSYYTTAVTTPSVFMAYDMIPECTGEELAFPMWKEKHYGIRHASSYIAISQNTADDLARLFPADAPREKITVALCAADPTASPLPAEQIEAFKRKYEITRPYFMTVGRREGYKNAVALFKAFAARGDAKDYSVVCVGGSAQLEADCVASGEGLEVHMLRLPDEELSAAYCGAVGLVYPSEYEGFGLPIVEAMSSGCPVITCRRGSIPEVAGDAAYFVEPHDIGALAQAMSEIQRPPVREALIRAGLERVKLFSWQRMAEQMSQAMLRAAEKSPQDDLARWCGQLQQATSRALELDANVAAFQRFSELRRELAERWLKVPVEQLHTAYAGPLGKAHRIVRSSGLYLLSGSTEEQRFIASLGSAEMGPPRARAAALLLYRTLARTKEALGDEAVPGWLAEATAESISARPKRHTWANDLTEPSRFRLIAAWNCLRNQGDALIKVFAESAQPVLDTPDNVDVPAATGEVSIIDEILQGLARGEDDPRAVNYRAAAMMYFRMHELPTWDPARIPTWMFDSFVAWTVRQPLLLGNIGEADEYFRRTQDWFMRMRDFLRSIARNPSWKRLAEPMALLSSFIPVYFSRSNLLPLLTARADILEMYMNYLGVSLAMDPPPRPAVGAKRIKLGLVKNHWQAGTETYATLPLFAHLPRDRFEVVLYAVAEAASPAEAHCRRFADRMVVLPPAVDAQAAKLREEKCDILFYAMNLTAITHSLVPLAEFRIAPVQVTSICSPATTALPTIDAFLVGELCEPRADAQNEYREKLVKLPGSGLCFDYTLRPPASGYSASREKLKIDANTVVFTSGANYFKIIPELRRNWARLLAAAPGSVLVLYPFGPAWHDNYPAGAFIRYFAEELVAAGVETKRLILLEPMPSASDVQKVMAITDVYLDSFPYTGATSMLDPLSAGVPAITMAGDRLRFAQGDAVLRELGLPELIAQSEEDYIRLAAELARDPSRRAELAKSIRAKMSDNPAIFDGKRFGKQIAGVFETLVREAAKKA